jgi:predicted metal-dependent enzyme (double-stranded beta helix superfamily)
MSMQDNAEAIIEAIGALDKIDYETVSKLLPDLLAQGKLTLDASVYEPFDPDSIEPSGIGRYLIYDNPDKENPFSIWAFALAPRQKTPIHDHKYKGTVTVLQGPVSEIQYHSTGESNFAKLVRCTDRYKFHTNRDDELNNAYVHQLKHRKNLRSGTSVTLHIYNMEAHCINNEGIINDNRNIKITYSKIPSDKSITRSYQEEYPPEVSNPFQMR